MAKDILSELVEKYNIKDDLIFVEIVKKALAGEIKKELIAYNLQQVLNMDLNQAVDLSNDIIFMSEEDKKALGNKINSQEKTAVDANSEINSLILEANLRLDEYLKNRLIKLLNTYFLGIRQEIDFKDALMRPSKIGGIGLSQEAADNLLEIARNKKKYWTENGIDFKSLINKISPDNLEEPDIDVKAKVKNFAGPAEKNQDLRIVDLLREKGISGDELATKEKFKSDLINAERAPKANYNFVQEIIEEEKFLDKKKEIAPPFEPVKKNANQISQPQPAPKYNMPPVRKSAEENRPKMEDIKYEAPIKLYGPVEELGALTIADFRRLSRDPLEAVNKIFGKLDLLEDESINKKIQGIRALKASPLYKLYAEIMNEAMRDRKTIEQAVNENKKMNLSEYKAISELNQSIKY